MADGILIMPRADVIHGPVKNALIKDGWTITADPYVIGYLDLRLFADLGAEYPLGAERANQKLVIEAKSFRDLSPMNDFKAALGQYLLYHAILEVIAPAHELYLAVSEPVYHSFFKLRAVQFVLQRYQVQLLAVDVETEEIKRWISWPDTES